MVYALRYKRVMERVDDLVDIAERLDIVSQHPYIFYRDILSGIYRGLDESDLLKLFSIHTAVQMYINSLVSIGLGRADDPVGLCSGEATREYGVSSPYLLWWRGLVERNEGKKILEICLEIISSVRSLSRDEILERDSASSLYESLVSRVIRYGAGEYYTPRWVVELVLNRLETMGARLAREIILDPSCGSGRFLISSLHRKISWGVEPSSAYSEVMGLDINPLAVSMARARLLISYALLVKREPPGLPAILWGDFISLSLGGSYIGVRDSLHSSIVDKIVRIVTRAVGFGKKGDNKAGLVTDLYTAILDLLVSLYNGLSEAGSHTRCGSFNPASVEKCSKIYRSLPPNLRDELAGLIYSYRGGLGIPIISSAIMGGLLRSTGLLEPGIVVTNPPWLEINELPKNSWGEMVKKYVNAEYAGSGLSPRHAIQKGDLSAVFLDLSLRWVRGGGYVGIVLPAGQSYSRYSSSHGVGKLLTYEVIERLRCSGEILYLGDVFRHGVEASIAVLRKGGGS